MVGSWKVWRHVLLLYPQMVEVLEAEMNDRSRPYDLNVIANIRKRHQPQVNKDIIIKQLQARIVDLEADCKILTVRPTLAEFNLLKIKLNKANEALNNYGEHHSWCNSQGVGKRNYTCTCGFYEALPQSKNNPTLTEEQAKQS